MYTTFTKVKDGSREYLRIAITDAGREELAEIRAEHPDYSDFDLFVELISGGPYSDHLGNGWSLLDPNQFALCSNDFLLSDTASFDDQGNLTKVDTVYAWDNYAIHAFDEIIDERGYVDFTGHTGDD
jgi:hypothetical protein